MGTEVFCLPSELRGEGDMFSKMLGAERQSENASGRRSGSIEKKSKRC